MRLQALEPDLAGFIVPGFIAAALGKDLPRMHRRIADDHHPPVRAVAVEHVQQRHFVGLLDAKADRSAGRLIVQNLRYDGPAKRRAPFDRSLNKALDAFARFNGVAPPSAV